MINKVEAMGVRVQLSVKCEDRVLKYMNERREREEIERIIAAIKKGKDRNI